LQLKRVTKIGKREHISLWYYYYGRFGMDLQNIYPFFQI